MTSVPVVGRIAYRSVTLHPGGLWGRAYTWLECNFVGDYWLDVHSILRVVGIPWMQEGICGWYHTSTRLGLRPKRKKGPVSDTKISECFESEGRCILPLVFVAGNGRVNFCWSAPLLEADYSEPSPKTRFWLQFSVTGNRIWGTFPFYLHIIYIFPHH